MFMTMHMDRGVNRDNVTVDWSIITWKAIGLQEPILMKIYCVHVQSVV